MEPLGTVGFHGGMPFRSFRRSELGVEVWGGSGKILPGLPKP